MKKKGIILGSILFVVLVGVIVIVTTVRAKDNIENSEEVVETVPLEKQNLEKSISVTGTITSNSQKVISSEAIDTKVVEVKVAVGDKVKKGDVLARLDRTNLEIKLKAAQTALEVAKKKSQIDINGAKRNVEQVTLTRNIELERSNKAVADAYKEYADAVAKRDSLNLEFQNATKKRAEKENNYSGAKSNMENTLKETENRRKTLENAQNNYDLALTKYEEATKETISANDLAKIAEVEALKNKKEEALNSLNAAKAAYNSTGAITSSVETNKASKETEYSQAKSDETSKEAEYKAAITNVDVTAKAYEKAKQAAEDTNRTTEKAVAEQNDSFLSAELSSKNAGNGQEEVEVNKYKELLEACDIIAPMDGMITSVQVQAGDVYKSGEIMTIQDTSKFMVSALVDQYDISDITKNMKANVKTQTTGEEAMRGIVTFVSPVPKSIATTPSSAGSSTGTNSTSNSDYEIKVSLSKGSERLRIGMTAKTSIVLKEIQDALVLPYYCIEEDTDGSFYVQIMGVNEIKRKMKVKKIMETDYYTAIEGDGLKDGMQVIVPSIVEKENEATETVG